MYLDSESATRQLEDLRTFAVAASNHIREVNQDLAVDPNDPRWSSGRHLKAVISSTYLSMIHFHESLLEKSYWQSFNTGPHQPLDIQALEDTIRDELEDYERLARTALLVMTAGLFEANVRRVGRALGIERGSWYRVRTAIFAELGEEGARDPDPLGTLAAIGELRNLIHNNGIYLPDREPRPIVWGEWDLGLEVGQVVESSTWELLTALVRELVAINQQVMTCEKVRSLPAL